MQPWALELVHTAGEGGHFLAGMAPIVDAHARSWRIFHHHPTISTDPPLGNDVALDHLSLRHESHHAHSPNWIRRSRSSSSLSSPLAACTLLALRARRAPGCRGRCRSGSLKFVVHVAVDAICVHAAVLVIGAVLLLLLNVPRSAGSRK
ncbi:hypothetical protein GGTG_04670 [Gaeumannomyces tritici R3-111a-1]|uniref:Uncharacterized protein n=1 Tax=Gaeumannomyces tritici (strain R3-111a-1) TaxID=644352 RepID=J3NTS0_GAET3|nr:hypothetical protein GGTG_04670 [Gaeumannomyces tritici R3-111a-1]EJT79585.1 hypothetical protein GGTG_04670 [Gaeumannomyces tritici R3-111a-1]